LFLARVAEAAKKEGVKDLNIIVEPSTPVSVLPNIQREAQILGAGIKVAVPQDYTPASPVSVSTPSSQGYVIISPSQTVMDVLKAQQEYPGAKIFVSDIKSGQTVQFQGDVMKVMEPVKVQAPQIPKLPPTPAAQGAGGGKVQIADQPMAYADWGKATQTVADMAKVQKEAVTKASPEIPRLEFPKFDYKVDQKYPTLGSDVLAKSGDPLKQFAGGFLASFDITNPKAPSLFGMYLTAVGSAQYSPPAKSTAPTVEFPEVKNVTSPHPSEWLLGEQMATLKSSPLVVIGATLGEIAFWGAPEAMRGVKAGIAPKIVNVVPQSIKSTISETREFLFPTKAELFEQRYFSQASGTAAMDLFIQSEVPVKGMPPARGYLKELEGITNLRAAKEELAEKTIFTKVDPLAGTLLKQEVEGLPGRPPVGGKVEAPIGYQSLKWDVKQVGPDAFSAKVTPYDKVVMGYEHVETPKVEHGFRGGMAPTDPNMVGLKASYLTERLGKELDKGVSKIVEDVNKAVAPSGKGEGGSVLKAVAQTVEEGKGKPLTLTEKELMKRTYSEYVQEWTSYGEPLTPNEMEVIRRTFSDYVQPARTVTEGIPKTYALPGAAFLREAFMNFKPNEFVKPLEGYKPSMKPAAEVVPTVKPNVTPDIRTKPAAVTEFTPKLTPYQVPKLTPYREPKLIPNLTPEIKLVTRTGTPTIMRTEPYTTLAPRLDTYTVPSYSFSLPPPELVPRFTPWSYTPSTRLPWIFDMKGMPTQKIKMPTLPKISSRYFELANPFGTSIVPKALRNLGV
jgi:hypothetical protein